jgi:hypothetical protein
MPKYCDSAELEAVWGQWMCAQATPELEPLRRRGLLYKQHLGVCVLYCIAKPIPFFFGTAIEVSEPQQIIDLVSDDPVDHDVTSILIDNNFSRSIPVSISWDKLSTMIYMICTGLTLKFNLPSDEERHELAHEAFEQTLKKITRGKLKFTAGRAPVFNLLTTAIIRMMYSIKNKEKRRRINQAKLSSDISSSTGLPKLRSLAIASSSV